MARVRTTEREVQEAVKELLDEMTKAPYYSGPFIMSTSDARHSAAQWLVSLGYAERREGNTTIYRLTPAGWEYWKQLQLGSTLYWLDKNWFPATVAAATFLVGIGTILAQVLD